MKEWLDECTVFPHGEHDDQVDAVSGAVQMNRRTQTQDLNCLINPLGQGKVINGPEQKALRVFGGQRKPLTATARGYRIRPIKEKELASGPETRTPSARPFSF